MRYLDVHDAIRSAIGKLQCVLVEENGDLDRRMLSTGLYFRPEIDLDTLDRIVRELKAVNDSVLAKAYRNGELVRAEEEKGL